MHERSLAWHMGTWLLLTLGLTIVPRPAGVEAQDKTAAKAAAPAQPGDELLGEWWTESRQGRIRFVRHNDGTYRGIVSWRPANLDTEDSPAIDRNNKNPKLRTRPMLGLVLIWKLVYEDGSWNDGYVYNPRNGSSYRFEAKLLDKDTLKIRGYAGISLFGASQIWKRFRP